MNWDAIGAIGEILGAIAVLATLFYLAIQIRQNSVATKSASAEFMLSAAQNTALAVATSNEAITSWTKGRQDYNSLDDTEKNRARLLYMSQMMASDNLYWSYRQGSLDEELWERQSNWMRGYLETEPGKAVWAQQTSHGGFTRGFVEYCEANFSEQLRDIEPVSDWKSV